MSESNSKRTILEMLEQGKITQEQAGQLLAAMEDEEGTEAAAATEVLMACGAAMEPQEYREVYFDEPFVYMIMDMERGIPLFMGILDDPGLQ